jgi:VWFA-related protein
MRMPIRWRGKRRQLESWPAGACELAQRFLSYLPAISLVVFFSAIVAAHGEPPQKQKSKLPKPRQLDQAISWQRDSATGEMRIASAEDSRAEKQPADSDSASIHIVTQMVPVTCSVYTTDGIAVPGLARSNFRVYDNGIEQKISYFDASSSPASIALVIDASPSVLRDSDEMKKAAAALVDALAPLDETAVLDFSAHTYVQLPFSDARELIRRAVDRIDVRRLLSDTGGSNIYEAVYLTAHELFPERGGRKAIVLLTDGQDSGLGLRLDRANAPPQSAEAEHRLNFDDVSRLLTSENIQLFALSTENRPKVMTPEWMEAHRDTTLITPEAQRLEIPPYTLYLAEMARRTGGQLDFLRESATMADAFRRIAQKIRAEYTLGYYPMTNAATDGAGWHALKVEVEGPANVSAMYRSYYYAAGR